MTRVLDQTDGFEPADLKLLSDIKAYGWHVVKVFKRDTETGPEWAFSVGLFHSFLHPEIVLFGLPLDRCARIINEIGLQIKAGKRFNDDEEFSGILADPYKVAFRTVRTERLAGFLGFALWFYEDHSFPVLQCFWPDNRGLFPWDFDCDSGVKGAQPLLFLGAPADH